MMDRSRFLRIRTHVGVCALSTVLLGTALAAQEARSISGTVIDTAGRIVAGALVATRDAHGELLARTLTGSNGAFVLPITFGVSMEVFALVVGYEPSDAVTVPVDLAKAQLTLVASPVRAHVTGYRPRQREICGPPRDTTSDVTRLWQEARKAIASTGLPYGTVAMSAHVQLFDHTVSRDGKTMVSERYHEADAASQRPFRSLTADSIARAGYVIETEEDVSYYLPDADALLSSAFAQQHCFGINTSTEEGFGLTFKPRNERPGVKEIEGTLWFDRETLELRRLEYRYTNVPPFFRTARIGGELRFSRLSNGAWIISRWEVRMPQGQIQSNLALQHSQVRNRQQVTVESVRVSGGQVLNVIAAGERVTVP